MLLTCGTEVMSIGDLLQGDVLEVEGPGRVMLLGVNDSRELGLWSQSHPSILPL